MLRSLVNFCIEKKFCRGGIFRYPYHSSLIFHYFSFLYNSYLQILPGHPGGCSRNRATWWLRVLNWKFHIIWVTNLLIILLPKFPSFFVIVVSNSLFVVIFCCVSIATVYYYSPDWEMFGVFFQFPFQTRVVFLCQICKVSFGRNLGFGWLIENVMEWKLFSKSFSTKMLKCMVRPY